MTQGQAKAWIFLVVSVLLVVFFLSVNTPQCVWPFVGSGLLCALYLMIGREIRHRRTEKARTQARARLEQLDAPMSRPPMMGQSSGDLFVPDSLDDRR